MQYESKTSLWLGGPAQLLEVDGRDLAWAERSIHFNPSLKWILGKYAEADRPNSNMQYWSLANLQAGQSTIAHSPLNMLHQPRRIVGHFADAEMLYPEQADDGQTPFVEALASFYRYYFPDELEVIEGAHAEGQLYFSMECVARSVTCSNCGLEFDYKGPSDASYCNHINQREAARQFNDPVFLGGALIVPPVKPGWKNASVKDISTMMEALLKENADQAEQVYEGVKADLPDQDPKVWEALMAQVMKMAEKSAVLDTKDRKSLSKSQFAIPEKAPGPGSYPIPDIGHAKNALSRASGKPEEGRVRAAVYKKFPALKGQKAPAKKK